MTETDRTVITVDEFVPYPVARVWQALTDPDKLKVWFMPNDFKPVVGHTFHFHRTANCDLHFSDRILCSVLEIRDDSCCPTPGPMPNMRTSSTPSSPGRCTRKDAAPGCCSNTADSPRTTRSSRPRAISWTTAGPSTSPTGSPHSSPHPIPHRSRSRSSCPRPQTL